MSRAASHVATFVDPTDIIRDRQTAKSSRTLAASQESTQLEVVSSVRDRGREQTWRLELGTTVYL